MEGKTSHCLFLLDHLIFARRPCFKLHQGFFAKLTKGKDYLEPAVLFSAVEELLHNRPYASRRLSEFPAEVEFDQTLAQALPVRTESVAPTSSAPPRLTTESRSTPVHRTLVAEKPSPHGYCIRTGEPIPFNPERPFSYAAYKSWASFGNEDYPERYCHKTGQPSLGRTSMRQPILTRF